MKVAVTAKLDKSAPGDRDGIGFIGFLSRHLSVTQDLFRNEPRRSSPLSIFMGKQPTLLKPVDQALTEHVAFDARRAVWNTQIVPQAGGIVVRYRAIPICFDRYHKIAMEVNQESKGFV